MMLGCLLSVGLLFGAAELRSPDVPFVAKNVKRVPAKPAVVGSSVTFGDRRIVLEPGQIVYSADGAKRFQLWHNFNHTVDGKTVYLRADEATVKSEATENGVTMTTRLLEGDKEIGQVLKTARLTADGDLVVTYRHTCPKGCMPIYNLRLYTTQMLGQTIGYNGKSVTLPNDLPGYKKFRSPDCGTPFTRFDCATNVAAVGFTLAMSGVKSQYSRTDVNDFDVRLFPTSDDAELVFTFRPVESSTPPDACILSGINFTANDNVRVYVPDPKRNLCMDPSFESKMRRTYNRYSAPIYTNANGRLVEQDVRAISDRPICVGTARTGRYSLRPGYGNWLLANNVPLQKDKTYVMSFYVRSDDGKKAVYGSTRRSENGFHTVNFRSEVTDWSVWTRVVSEPFVAGARNDINLGGSKNLLVDDVQIEEGTEATPFVAGALGFEMVTDSPGETVCDAAFNYRPRVRVSGDRTLKGTLRLTGRDFFDRQLFVKDVPLALGETAEFFVDLPETKDLPLGPTYVNLEVDMEGRGEFVYRDTVRLVKVVRPPEHAKHRFFFAGLAPHICTTKEQLDLLGFLFRHDYGFWVKDEKDAALLDPNLMISMKGTWNYDPKSGPNWKFYEGDFLISDWQGQNMWKATEYPEAFLKDLEDAMAKYAAARPWCTHWFHRREDNGIGSLQAGRMDEFAKYIAAIHRGVKRGNPAATMEGIGHCSHADEGVQYLVPFLKESKRLFPELKYHAVCAHPYCAHPEIPDLDKTLGALIRNVSEVAGPDIKFVFDEGGYYVSQTMPERSFAPWAPTSDKDMAGGEQRFSRDAGWAEHVAAAMHMRYMVMIYKYIDRIIDHREWTFLGGDEPYAWTAMNSAFHRLLGDAEFADNFEFAPAARVYFFRDGHGRFIAIPWLFSREMDYGREEGQRMFLDLKGLHPEFVDIMGNVCTTKEKDGVRDLPLNNYPYYVIVPEAEAEQLKDAFRKVEYTPKADVIPFHIATKPLSAEAFEVTISNPFATEKHISVKVGEEAAQDIVLAPGKPVTLRAKFPEVSKDGVINDYAIPIAVTWNGATSHESLLMRTWNVPHVGTGPVDWTKVPAIRLTGKMPKSWKGPNDFSSVCRLAWREGELLLRTETSDDVFVPSPAETKKGRGWFFESTQVFVDAFGNGRENLRKGVVGFDEDDFVYDVFATDAKTAKVYRNRVPDQQLTFGLDAPKAGTYSDLPCVFEVKDGRRTLTLSLRDNDIAPAKLSMERPFALAVMVHDIDSLKDDIHEDPPYSFGKANVCTIPPEDGGAFQNPQHYAWLILED